VPTQVTETLTTGAVVQEADNDSGRMKIHLITPGWGSSGYYSQDVLETAGDDKVWPKGTQVFLDHPSETERYDRPERSVKDLAGVLETDAVWDGTGLAAELRTFGPFRGAIAEMAEAEAIGMSIRASAEAETGEAEGRKGNIVTRLVEGFSVDFVTKAGRGGKVLAVLESAKANTRPRSMAIWEDVSRRLAQDNPLANPVREATVNDRREALQGALRDAHGGDDTWVWVRDFDPDTGLVYFDVEGDGGYATYSQPYTTGDDGAVALTGDRTPVRATTTYVPDTGTTTAPSAAAEAHEAATAAETTTPTKETPMGNIQVDEARVRDLEEKAGLIPALEARVTAAETRAETAEERARQAEAGTYARDFARTLVTKANGDLAEASVARIVKTALAGPLPLAESGRLDTDKFTPTVEAARADEETYLGQVAEASGVGRVRGVGHTGTTTAVTEADVDEAIARAFGRKGA